jgi:hypothetical protein
MSLPPFHASDDLNDLADLMTRRPLALVGAGASVASGYPDWKALFDHMEKRLKRVSPGKLSPMLKELNDPAWQAEELYVHLKEDEYYRFLRETFAEPQPPNEVSEPHYLIARLGFRHILTTNYDPCIEIASRGFERPYRPLHWNNHGEANKFFRALSHADEGPYVVYLHGHHTRPEDIILTESSYSRAYLDETNQRRLVAIFITQPVVFVGFSMNDPDLGYLMRLVRTDSDGMTQHFGIFGCRTADERELIRRRMEGKYGIRSVFYRIDDDGSHACLLQLLEHLGKFKTLSRSHPKTESAQPGATATSSTDSNIVNALDPHKGQFGGLYERNGRRLYVTDLREVKKDTYMAFTLVVESLPGFAPLVGNVRFQLHPTFDEPDYAESAINGRAESQIRAAYGAFTVGVTFEGGKKLELDLSELEIFPPWFRER